MDDDVYQRSTVVQWLERLTRLSIAAATRRFDDKTIAGAHLCAIAECRFSSRLLKLKRGWDFKIPAETLIRLVQR